MIFSPKDIIFLKSKGISEEVCSWQYKMLCAGTEFPELILPATVRKGIYSPEEADIKIYTSIFEENRKNYDCIRFIPASGAATRMFSFLSDWMNTKVDTLESDLFFSSISKFAFSDLLKNPSDREELLNYLLSEQGMNYSGMPKGLLAFHKKREGFYTAFESQLEESKKYALSKSGVSQTHFTISEDHHPSFNKILIEYQEQESGQKSQVTFSYQSSSTDTIAIDENNELIRDADGNIMLRPGGHGSLLSNLNELNQDIVFIRNIDNVVSPDQQEEYVSVHKMMGGMLIDLLEKLFSIQKKLDENRLPDSPEKELLSSLFGIECSDLQAWKDHLFRPVRVCGMVKNTGEPGGGPFWVKDENGISLQIIESAQVNKNNETQVKIFQDSSHFNPVDIVCSFKNYKGEKYRLSDFCKKEFSFVSEKNQNGTKMKILEHPGLWNGSMHHWLTVFVEIPVTVFNPVKTVNDLLRSAHQK